MDDGVINFDNEVVKSNLKGNMNIKGGKIKKNRKNSKITSRQSKG